MRRSSAGGQHLPFSGCAERALLARSREGASASFPLSGRLVLPLSTRRMQSGGLTKIVIAVTAKHRRGNCKVLVAQVSSCLNGVRGAVKLRHIRAKHLRSDQFSCFAEPVGT